MRYVTSVIVDTPSAGGVVREIWWNDRFRSYARRTPGSKMWFGMETLDVGRPAPGEDPTQWRPMTYEQYLRWEAGT